MLFIIYNTIFDIILFHYLKIVAHMYMYISFSDREDLDVEGLTQLEYLEEKDKEIGNTLQNLLRKVKL